MNKRFEGFKNRVIPMSIADINSIQDKNIKKEYYLAYLVVGGFSAYRDDEGFRINVLTDIADQMTDEEVRAILYHEEGHIVLGHQEQQVTAGIQVNFEHEHAADDYACQFVSPSVVYSALKKITEITPQLIVKLGLPEKNGLTNEQFVEMYRSETNNEAWRTRLERLIK